MSKIRTVSAAGLALALLACATDQEQVEPSADDIAYSAMSGVDMGRVVPELPDDRTPAWLKKPHPDVHYDFTKHLDDNRMECYTKKTPDGRRYSGCRIILTRW